MIEIKGNIVDIHKRIIFPGIVCIEGERISAIHEIHEDLDTYILPGFVDAHVHIESSMIIPTEFSRLCIPHGTIATVSDPHEIGNVLGMKGIEFMLENAKQSPLTIIFGAPSCVPATDFETAGSVITAQDIETLFSNPQIGYLSEMMNYPGVLHKDPEVMSKIAMAHAYNKPIDGHAPGLKGDLARSYIEAGIFTDHECYSLEEALDKVSYGMNILIREGSAAKNFDALHPLIGMHPDKCMFCSDDKHPNDLLHGHINTIVSRAIGLGYDIFDVLKIAHLNPKNHYSIPIGSLNIGDFADFLICSDLNIFNPTSVYIKGKKIAEYGNTLDDIPRFDCADFSPCAISTIQSKALSILDKSKHIRVIGCIPGELTTQSLIAILPSMDGFLHSDTNQDILKITIINRYVESTPALAFVKGIGLKQGAIASTIAHDSHNIICVGVDDESMTNAINQLIMCKGGIAYANGSKVECLPLNIAGLMSSDDGYHVASEYDRIDDIVRQHGSNIHAPFMTLSFLGLLVIPSLKLSDKGLFDGDKFTFTSLYLD
ncbi:MAG: adenine deaminase [Ignavibacteria bacterium]|jgi:adenine deaminase